MPEPREPSCQSAVPLESDGSASHALSAAALAALVIDSGPRASPAVSNLRPAPAGGEPEGTGGVAVENGFDPTGGVHRALQARQTRAEQGRMLAIAVSISKPAARSSGPRSTRGSIGTAAADGGGLRGEQGGHALL